MIDRRAVLVTGASSGIGEAAARRLVARGFHVFGGYRSQEDADRLAKWSVKPIPLDVTDPDAVSGALSTIERSTGGGGLWGLVNNAGIPGAGPIELTPIDTFRQVMDVNVLGVLRVTRAALPLVRRARGRIVMVSSLSGIVSMPFLAPYTASKFALEAVSDSLRRELLPEGIEVVVVEPGPIDTPIWGRVAELDPHAFEGTPYSDRVRELRDGALESGKAGLPADAVAEVIERALTARRPQPRSMVTTLLGRLKVRLVRRLPERVADQLIVGSRR